MESSALESAESWLAVIWWAKLVAAGLVAIGVVMEFGGDWIASPFEKTVSEARKLEIAKLEARALDAETEIAKANEIAAKANERAAELKLALEREVAARQPRRINQQQRDSLFNSLSKISEKGAIVVSSKLFDEEAERFGKQILQVLSDSGFVAKEVRGSFSFGTTGQVMLVRDFKKWQSGPSWVGEVQAALRASLGLEFPGYQMDSSFSQDFGDIAIVIAAKP
ncbi:MAG TPA: hypothetical protein VEK34_05915 [Methylocella sp.]|nr:hypothetical protein [Methylocella sp.]